MTTPDTPASGTSPVAPEVTCDRELEQYRIAEAALTERVHLLETKMDQCRDGGDLLADYRRFDGECRSLKAQLSVLIARRHDYVMVRNRLAAWGPTDTWVVAGSIVEGAYLGGARDTFVLTERPSDTEYPTCSYSSPMGLALRRKRVGDTITVSGGSPFTIDSIVPGFRVAPATPVAHPPAEQAPTATRSAEHMPTGTESDEWLLRQRCSEKAYREDLYRRRADPHVRPLNAYVDQLRVRRRGAFIPYLAPTYGGVNARLLTLYQDPGPKTDPANANGSGMLCLENADISAARAKYFLRQADITASDVISWNAYPWAKPHPQSEATDRDAADALHGFLALTPRLEVVVLNGTVANRIWTLMAQLHPHAVNEIVDLTTYHPSPRVVDPAEKPAHHINKVNGNILDTYAAAGRLLRAPSSRPAAPAVDDGREQAETAGRRTSLTAHQRRFRDDLLYEYAELTRTAFGARRRPAVDLDATNVVAILQQMVNVLRDEYPDADSRVRTGIGFERPGRPRL